MWGCLAKVGLLAFKKGTIKSKIVNVIFVGYALNSVVYRIMSLHDHSICEFRDVIFFENVIPLNKSSTSTDIQLHERIFSSSTYNRDVRNNDVELRRSKRQMTATISNLISFVTPESL